MAVKIGKRLLAGLIATREVVKQGGLNTDYLDQLILKAEADLAPKETQALKVSVQEVTDIMRKVLGDRVVTHLPSTVYIRATGLLKRHDLDAEKVTALVEWISRQSWLKGNKTILDVLGLCDRYLETALSEKRVAVAPRFALLEDD